MLVSLNKLFLQSIGTYQHDKDRPLIVYALLESKEQANADNFDYYLRQGIREDDGCLHIILVAADKVFFIPLSPPVRPCCCTLNLKPSHTLVCFCCAL